MNALPIPTISIASYNVLCDSYIQPQYYPLCDPADFLPEVRHPRLIERVAGLGTDVICLQEVDFALFKALRERLALDGYRGRWAHKDGNKPDGCATFIRDGVKLRGTSIFIYDDGRVGRSPSGHVATYSLLEVQGEMIGVVNTHLKWDSPETPEESQVGLVQMRELLKLLKLRHPQLPTVLCADFNAEAGSAVMYEATVAGFGDAHFVRMPFTCVANGAARKIDAIMHNGLLRAEAWQAPMIDVRTALPSASEPSDHVPLCATFTICD